MDDLYYIYVYYFDLLWFVNIDLCKTIYLHRYTRKACNIRYNNQNIYMKGVHFCLCIRYVFLFFSTSNITESVNAYRERCTWIILCNMYYLGLFSVRLPTIVFVYYTATRLALLHHPLEKKINWTVLKGVREIVWCVFVCMCLLCVGLLVYSGWIYICLVNNLKDVVIKCRDVWII